MRKSVHEAVVRELKLHVRDAEHKADAYQQAVFDAYFNGLITEDAFNVIKSEMIAASRLYMDLERLHSR